MTVISSSLIGLGLGLTSGFFEAVINTYINHKKKSIPPILMGLTGFLFLFPLSILAFFIFEIPEVKVNFFMLLLVFCILNVVARILYVKAIHCSGMAKTIPYLSFTPLFLIVVGYYVVKELPSILGGAGILLIVAGAILLSKRKNTSLFYGLKKEKGALLMLTTAIIFSFTASIARFMFSIAPDVFVVACVMFIQPFIFVPAAINESGIKNIIKHLRKDNSFFLILGILFAITELTIFFGLSFTKVAYVNSMKRTTILFSILFGYLFFKEPGFRKNLFAGILMMLGVVMIGIYG
jgi:drug/metabolite transporter (DMT)-like permease